jgi:DNA-binding IclR family transcriptional regulator
MEALILDIAVQRRRIATDALIAEAVRDIGDEREVSTARRAISSLREHGLLEPEREDGTLEPTTAAIKAAALEL